MRSEKTQPLFISLAAIVLLALFASASGQTTSPNQNGQTTPQNNAAGPPPQAQNLETELGFTPEQRVQWRQINREFRVQQMDAAAKVHDARLSLNAAMESPNPNEEVIKQRAKELADAQSAVTQLQALRQARVLQMLTPEQRIKAREIRERTQALKREQQGANTNALAPGRGLKRNNNAPLLTPAQRKALRQQQQQKQKP